jgi:cytidylate kinase
VVQVGLRSAEDTQRVMAELAARDQRDRTRSASPLVAAPDAVHIDTTHKSIDDVVAEVEGVIGRVVSD